MNFEFTFLNEYHSDFDNYEEIYENIAKVVFKHLNLNNFFIFEVDLVDAKTIHEINKTYRKIDRETDVISFAFEDDDSYKQLVSNQDVPRDIGEIFICVDVAKRQAEEYKHSFNRGSYSVLVCMLIFLFLLLIRFSILFIICLIT